MVMTFEDRENAFEAKFAHDEAFRFRVAARRDKLFAHWAAEQLELSGAETGTLVAAVLHIPDGPGHDAALVARIGATLSMRRPEMPEAELHAILHGCEEHARAQLLAMPLDHPDLQ